MSVSTAVRPVPACSATSTSRSGHPWQSRAVDWWETQAAAAVAGAVVTGVFLGAQSRQAARIAAAERREQRAASRAQRLRAAAADLADALTDLLSAYSRVVESAREDPKMGGMSEFNPAIRDIDPVVITAARKSWARYQMDTGLLLPLRRDHDTALRRLNMVLDEGTVPVFHNGKYQGETLADLSHAYALLGDLRASTEAVLATAQAHADGAERELDAPILGGLRRLRSYLDL